MYRLELTEIQKRLEKIYLDYFDGLYTDHQLKFMLSQLFKQCEVPEGQWSNIILDAQWKYGTEEDYEIKK